jgi:hypothetical protein
LMFVCVEHCRHACRRICLQFVGSATVGLRILRRDPQALASLRNPGKRHREKSLSAFLSLLLCLSVPRIRRNVPNGMKQYDIYGGHVLRCTYVMTCQRVCKEYNKLCIVAVCCLCYNTLLSTDEYRLVYLDK